MYCVQADILKFLPLAALVGLTDDEGLGEINATRVTEAIAAADAVINARLGVLFEVPLASTPDLVRAFSIDIAIYNLYARRGAVPELWSDRYKAAIATLKDIVKGEASLGIAAASVPDAPAVDSGAETSTPTDERIFTRETMQGY